MRARSLLLVMLVAATASAKGLAPAGEIKLEAEGQLKYMSYCAANRFLAATLEGGTPVKQHTSLFQLEVDKRTARNLGSLSTAHELAFNADCTLVALGVTTGRDATQQNEVHLYKLSPTAAPVRVVAFGGFKYPVGALAFVDARTLAVGFNAGALELWSFDAAAGKATALARRELSDTIMSLASASGLLAIGTYKGALHLARVAGGKLEQLATLLGPSPDHRDTGSLDVTTGEVVMPGGGRIFELAFLAKGTRLLASQETGRVVLWPVANGKPGKRALLASKLGAISAMAVSGDEQLVAAGDDKRVTVWRSGTLVTELDKLDRVQGYAAFNGLQFAGPRDLLVGAYFSAAVRVYRID